MKICDTSWLYALLDLEDEHHDDAVTRARQASEVAVPWVALLETLQVVRYRARKLGGDAASLKAERTARKSLESIPGLTRVDTIPAQRAAEVHDRHPNLSFADAIIVATALASDDELLSYDADQQEALRRERKSR